MATPSLFDWRNAILHSDLEPTVRLALLVISTHMTANGTGAFPSQRTIAKEMGISDRWVKVLLGRAESQGWVSRRLYPNPSGKGWRRTHYGIVMPHGGEVVGNNVGKVRNSTSPPKPHGGEVRDASWGTPLPTNSSMNSSTGEEKNINLDTQVLRGTSPLEGTHGDTFIEIVTTESIGVVPTGKTPMEDAGAFEDSAPAESAKETPTTPLPYEWNKLAPEGQKWVSDTMASLALRPHSDPQVNLPYIIRLAYQQQEGAKRVAAKKTLLTPEEDYQSRPSWQPTR
jgi:Helix-turn-helix domain